MNLEQYWMDPTIGQGNVSFLNTRAPPAFVANKEVGV